ncbi:P-loop containing nucleoside triphosphate hydrolase protein [Dimargaris cristalligena]|uniref:P-loop containing nucleoside triphosphate hydrolase protein n=1 Tax=Dimargaris cristalligena TaxID=215637 RepID=A0A4Q0A2L5_9FUNG|nr:P-loop containing nucleoside triphosphate hydrolase protein [Dimargaris cristalligena]|eukprot:RKP40355.1 P-loop containing nucleoside triphosphate hydrolase protein [Dimargaris cristalligena]
MSDSSPNYRDTVATFKLLLIGDSNVGKSSLILRFTDDIFLPPEETSATIGVDFRVKLYDVEDKRYKLTIWDTAGQEKFRTLTSSCYRGVHGVILVYDVSRRDTFEHLDQWLNELNTYCSDQEVVKMIVGNKIDMESERMVSRQEGADYARRTQSMFIECSAKTRVGVYQAVDELVRKVSVPIF